MHLEVLHPWTFAALAVILPVVVYVAVTTYDPMRRGRKALVVATRSLVVVGIVAGLASVRWWRQEPEQKLCVLALLDVSASVPDSAIDQVMPGIQELFAGADDHHAVGLIFFAGSAHVAISPDTHAPQPDALRKAVDAVRKSATGAGPAESPVIAPESTNVKGALDLAMGVFPPGFARRIVLFSDGNVTEGDTIAKVEQCRQRQVDLQTSALSHDGAPFDLAVSSLVLPTRVQPGVGFDVVVNLAARQLAKATLELYRNGYLLQARPLDLAAGRHQETFRQRLDEPGLALYRARVTSERKQDSLANDVAFAFTRLSTQPKVLVLGEADSEARHLLQALKQANTVTEFRTPDGTPEQMSDLLDFDAVILNNLGASSISTGQQRLLRDYVEFFGGALLCIGLDPSGGYTGSPIEEALPVVTDLNRLSKPSISVVVVADTSQSLILADRDEAGTRSASTARPSAVDRPALIRRTSDMILAALSERDYFGLIGFGSEQYAPRWAVRPQKVYDRERIQSTIERLLQPGPHVTDPQALARLIASETDPAVQMSVDELARRVEGLLDANHRPHVLPKQLMPFLRNTLQVRRPGINSDRLAQEIERLVEPNAFLARSNAYRSFVRAVNELNQSETARKMIILVSDGYLQGDVDYTRIAGQLAADGITVSTIALTENDANKGLLETIAHWGGGRLYRMDDPQAFQKRFRDELESIQTPRVMEFPFRARKLADSPMLRGLNVELAPQLFGYVRTTPKLGAGNLLAVPPDYEPLLASWDFGAGRTAVFTSDAQERWATLWVRDWPQGYNQLWSSVIHALCDRPGGRRIIPQLDVDGQQVTLTADFTDAAGGFLNGQTLKARFYALGEEGYVFSRTAVEEVPMEQAAPGRYVCHYRAPTKGIYIARIAGPEPRDVVATGMVVSLLAEETSLVADRAALRQWASAGGGSDEGSPTTWLQLAGKSRPVMVDLSKWAVVLAVLLFAVDVVLRRWPAFVHFFRERRRVDA